MRHSPSSPGHPVRSSDSYLVFGSPRISERAVEAIAETLRSGWIGTGPRVRQFEEEFARHKRAEHAVAVSSCTAGLQLALMACNLKPGSEVITTPITFCATINAIVHAGLTPVLADIDPLTWNIDPLSVTAKLGPRTGALLPVHFAGRMAPMKELSRIADEHGLYVVEDCAHAIETEGEDHPAGTIGDFGCFSFYATKNITTAEGGMVLCRNEESAERVRLLSNHGLSKGAWERYARTGRPYYEVEEFGFKYNMHDISAALGLVQLSEVDDNWQQRQRLWYLYQEALRDLPLQRPAVIEDSMRHAHHLYTVCVDGQESATRDELIDHMHENNIGTGIHYRSMPEHRFYQAQFGWRPDDFPNAWKYGTSTLSLPLSPVMSDADAMDVVEACRRFFGR